MIMNNQLVLLHFALLHIVVAVSRGCVTYYLDENGKDQGPCSSVKPCLSLKYVTMLLNQSSIRESICIKILSPMLELEEPVVFDEMSNVSVIGEGTTIRCGFYQHEKANFGMVFNRSRNIVLQNFTISECGLDGISNANFSTLKINEVTNFTMSYVQFINNAGIGLLVNNVSGSVTIDNCAFIGNSYQTKSDCSNSGGLTIFLSHANEHQSLNQYDIRNCKFHNNSYSSKSYSGSHCGYTVKGGGLEIVFLANASNYIFAIIYCNFTSNSANNGGGLFLQATENSSSNAVWVFQCIFEHNIVHHGGGAGVDAGMNVLGNLTSPRSPRFNRYMFFNCKFINNTSYQYAGAVGLFTTFGQEQTNVVQFHNCIFSGNQANGGAAVNVNRVQVTSHGFSSAIVIITEFKFFECSFIDNKAGLFKKDHVKQSGVFFTREVSVKFYGTNRFINNVNTALYGASAAIGFGKDTSTDRKNASITFIGNSGDRGGAILLVGDAWFDLDEFSNLTFKNNTAAYGGAICVIPLQTHFLYFTDTCFIKCSKHGNIYFIFDSNKATTGVAHDIFVSTLSPCNCHKDVSNCKNLTNFHIGCNGANFIFSQQNVSAVATAPISIVTEEANLYLFPGIPHKLNVTQIDFFNQITMLYPVSARIVNPTSDMRMATNSATLVDNTITVMGHINASSTLILEPGSLSSVQKTLNVTLADCPAGYYYDDKRQSCQCLEMNDAMQCDGAHLPTIAIGHWAGYHDGTFYTGICAAPLCTYPNHSAHNGHCALPLTNNATVLEEFVCASNRQGTLCGVCSKGYSTLYHSPSYRCANTTCKYGVVLYLVLELLPVTVIFLTILFFDIRLTSGAFYTFLFYGQFMANLYINAYGVIPIMGSLKTATTIYRNIYGISDLEVLTAEPLAFCLWPNATVLHLFMIKYVTTLYALLLIILTVAILKVNSLYTCIKLCHRLGRRDIRGSIINTLSAFIILCYSQCVRVTFSILIRARLDSKDHSHPTHVPLFNGELKYMKGGHLYFAVPAILCLIIIILPPPLILLAEPLLIKISSKLPRGIAYFFYRMRMKMKPFLDSFQGCFKDSCRIFAGLFFLYRIIIHFPALYSGKVVLGYMTAEGILFLLLLLHCLAQPFQKRWHNYLDIFLLLSLLAVNTLTIINYHYINWNNNDAITTYVIIQLFLLTLPLLYISGYIGCFFGQRIKSRIASFNIAHVQRLHVVQEHPDEDIEESLPARLLSESMLSMSYNTF